MTIFRSSTDTMEVVKRPGSNYDFRTRTMYMDGKGRRDEGDGEPEPQGFLIEIGPPGGSILPHFHEVRQFQIFVDGGGSLGSHSVDPVVVHYTDAYTTYGPIDISENGLAYFTLRHQWDPGAQYMPGARDKERGVPGKPGRHFSVRLPEGFLGEEAVTSGRSEEVLFGPDGDGLAVYAGRYPAGDRIVGGDPSEGDGAYWLVIEGCLNYNGRVLPERSLIYVRRTDEPLDAVAGDDGVTLVCAQFGSVPKLHRERLAKADR